MFFIFSQVVYLVNSIDNMHKKFIELFSYRTVWFILKLKFFHIRYLCNVTLSMYVYFLLNRNYLLCNSVIVGGWEASKWYFSRFIFNQMFRQYMINAICLSSWLNVYSFSELVDLDICIDTTQQNMFVLTWYFLSLLCPLFLVHDVLFTLALIFDYSCIANI